MHKYYISAFVLFLRVFSVTTFAPSHLPTHYLISSPSLLSVPIRLKQKFVQSSPHVSTTDSKSSERGGGISSLRRLGRAIMSPVIFVWKRILYIMTKLKGEDSSSMSLKVRDTLVKTKELLYRAEDLIESSIEMEKSERTKEKLLETEQLVQQAETMIEASLDESTETALATSSVSATLSNKPFGSRWAVAADDVNLSGKWEVVVTDEFKKDYDLYLTELGQPLLVRSVALGIISLTTEFVEQAQGGKSLLIRGKNVRGTWDRTLVASGTEPGLDTYTPLQIPVMSADSEKVEAESWWEDNGRSHVSWLRGVKKYGGGAFESRRYLNGDEYVCESTFHPDSVNKKPIQLVWRFRRQTVMEGVESSA